MSVTQGRLKATVMDADQIRRSLSRIAHEIVERNRGTEDVVLIGIVAKGDHIAARLPPKLMELEGSPVAVGSLDVSQHRDDRTCASRLIAHLARAEIAARSSSSSMT